MTQTGRENEVGWGRAGRKYSERGWVRKSNAASQPEPQKGQENKPSDATVVRRKFSFHAWHLQKRSVIPQQDWS